MFAPEPKAIRQQRGKSNGAINPHNAKQTTQISSRKSSLAQLKSKSPIRTFRGRVKETQPVHHSGGVGGDQPVKTQSNSPISGSQKMGSYISSRHTSQQNLHDYVAEKFNNNGEQKPSKLSTETYTINIQQQLQMSGLTTDSGIFGNRAMSTTNNSVAGGVVGGNSNSRSHSRRNVISPANSDLAGIPGSEELIYDPQLMQQQRQQLANYMMAAQMQPKAPTITIVQAAVDPKKRKASAENSSKSHTRINNNFPLKQQQSLPSKHQMKIGIRKFEKNVQSHREANTQSRACLQVLPENSAIINGVIQKRVKPQDCGPSVHSKDDYVTVSKIIHFAFTRRKNSTQPLFTQAEQKDPLTKKRRHQSSCGPGDTSQRGGKSQRETTQRAASQKGVHQKQSNRSTSSKRRDMQHCSFGGDGKNHFSSISSQKPQNHHNFVSVEQTHQTATSAKFGGGIQTISRCDSSLQKQHQQTSVNLHKEIDLRPEEILDAYWIVMRSEHPGKDMSQEFPIYNLLAQMSQIVAYSVDMTWSKALESHFSQNLFKAKALCVSQNFIYRKFFCKWLERFLQRQSAANLTGQKKPEPIVTQQTMGDDPQHSYSDLPMTESTQQMQFQKMFQNEEGVASFRPNNMTGNSFGINPNTNQYDGGAITANLRPISNLSGTAESERLKQTSQSSITLPLHHIPSQETLKAECQDTIEGAQSPVSETFHQNVILAAQQILMAGAANAAFQYNQVKEPTPPNYSFSGSVKQQSEQQLLHYQQEYQPNGEVAQVVQLQKQKTITSENSDVQKAIVSLLSQRTMNETLTEAFQQQQVAYLDNTQENFKKKSLIELVQQMQSQKAPQDLKRLNQQLAFGSKTETSSQQMRNIEGLQAQQQTEQLQTANFYKRQSSKTSQQSLLAKQHSSLEANAAIRLGPEQVEGLKKGMRRAKRAIQNVRQRIATGFLRFTYTDEWLHEAFQRWRIAIQVPCQDQYQGDQLPIKQQHHQTLSQGVMSDDDDALALVDKTLLAMQHRQNQLKLRCFSGLTLYKQRGQLMTHMGDQLLAQGNLKLVHRALFEWDRRFKERMQRKKRLGIADGYFRYALMSHVFAGWTTVHKEEAQDKVEVLRQNSVAFKACNYFAEGAGLESEVQDSDQEVNSVLLGHVFRELRGNFERMRDFKIKMADKMLRQSLLEFYKITQRQKMVRTWLSQKFREKTRSLAGEILTSWLAYAKRAKRIKHGSMIIAIKRGGKMKKLIWKVLSRNAKVRRTERQETQFASIFFYQLVIKRTLKAFRLNTVREGAKRARLSNAVKLLSSSSLTRVFSAMKKSLRKQKTLRQREQTFTTENHTTALKVHMLMLWREEIECKNTIQTFQRRQLKSKALNRLQAGTSQKVWYRQITDLTRAQRTQALMQSIFSTLDTYRTERVRLRTLYSTQFSLSTSRIKKLTYDSLRKYSDRQKELRSKETELVKKFSRKRKSNCLQELRVYTESQVQKHLVVNRARRALKTKVIRAMAVACRRQQVVNQTFAEVSTTHYEILCKGLLLEWQKLTLTKIERRDSLLQKQQIFAAKRFFGKLRLQTQISFVKRTVFARLETFRNERLKVKSVESFKAYLTSESCANYKRAKKIRAELLKQKAMAAFSKFTKRQALCKAFQKKKVKTDMRALLGTWLSKVDKNEQYRQIFSDLGTYVQQKVFAALKAHWAKKQIRRAKFEQCVLVRRHFLKELALNSWLDFCARKTEKNELEVRKGQLADNIYLATLMHHWLQRSKKGHSVRAIGFLVERTHKARVLSRFLQQMRIEFHKQCFVDQVNRKRAILQVQDIFAALRDYSSSRRRKRELNETRISILTLQRKRKVFQTLKMQHFLSKIAKPPLLKSSNRYAQVTQTPTLESRRQGRSRSRSQNKGRQGPLSMSTLTHKVVPTTPINNFMHSSIQSNGSAERARYRYAAEGAQDCSFTRHETE